MKLRRRWFVLATLALVASLLAVGGTTSAAKAGAKKGVTIEIWDYFAAAPDGTPERNALNRVAQAWAKKTGNRVVNPGTISNRENKFITAAQAGQGPDIYMGAHDRLGSFVAPGIVAPVPSTLLSKKERVGYNPVSVQAMSIKGRMYGIPLAAESYFLYYNKTLIKTAPKTWAQLISKAKALTSGDRYGFLWDTTNFYYDYAFIHGYGGYVFKHTKSGLDPKKLGLATSGSIRGFQFIADLVRKHNLTPATTNTGIMEGKFSKGDAAMIIDGPWAVPGFKKDRVPYGVAPLPSLAKNKPLRPFIGFQGLMVNSKSKHQKEAWDLAKYLSEHLPLPLYKAAGRVPVLTKVAKLRVVTSSAVTRAVLASSRLGEPMPNIPQMSTVWGPMANALTAIVQGKATAREAALEAQQAIERAIAQQGGG
jgi:arabinogalactan oligomer / maltooligosaccharide transport system substrate-binding protein